MRFAKVTLAIAWLAVAMLVASAHAKVRKADHAANTGTFVSTTAGKMVMVGQDGKEHTHPMAKDVKVTIDGKSGTLSGLKKGMKISVTTDKTGTVTAISTVADKPASGTKAAAPAKSAAVK